MIFVLSAKVFVGRRISKSMKRSLDLKEIGDILVTCHGDIPSPNFQRRTHIENHREIVSISSQSYHQWSRNQAWFETFVEMIRQYNLRLDCLGLSFDDSECWHLSQAIRMVKTIPNGNILLLKIKLTGTCYKLSRGLNSYSTSVSTGVELRIFVTYLAQEFKTNQNQATAFLESAVSTNSASIVQLDMRCFTLRSKAYPGASGCYPCMPSFLACTRLGNNNSSIFSMAEP